MKTSKLVAAAHMGNIQGAYHKKKKVFDKSTQVVSRKSGICKAGKFGVPNEDFWFA